MVQTKQILCEVNRSNLEQTLQLEKRGQYAMRQTADHKEGIAAFLENVYQRLKGNKVKL